MSKSYLCFDVGGTNVKYGVLQSNGTITMQSSFPTNKHDADLFISDMVQCINDLSATYTFEMVAVSFPGFIDPYTGFAHHAGAIEVLDGQNIKALIEQNIDLPVVIENDANCAALAEKLNGNAVRCADFICMTVGTGIGGGIFINNQLVRGHSFRAGEFGMMIVNGLEHGYQNMHQIASTSALIQRYKEVMRIDQLTIVEGEEVFQATKDNTELQKEIDQWYHHLSAGIFNLISTLNPEKLLIGGAISIRDDLFEAIHQHLNQIDLWQAIKVPIEPCKHHNNAGLLGALYVAMENP